MWHAVAAVFALTGTVIQAVTALRELSVRDPQIVSALAIDDLKREVPRWRLVAWSRHQRIVKRLMEESPVEAAAYRRVWVALWTWSLLAASAAMATAGALGGLLA